MPPKSKKSTKVASTLQNKRSGREKTSHTTKSSGKGKASPKEAVRKQKPHSAKNANEIPKKRGLSGSSQSPTTHTKKRKRKNAEPQIFKNFTLRPSAYAKWGPISKTTEKFVKKILDANLLYVMEKTSSHHQDTAQEMLNELHPALVSSIQGMKVPKAAITSNEKLHKDKVALEECLNENTELIARLEEAIDEEEELTKQLELEKEALEKSLRLTRTPTPNKYKIHPAMANACNSESETEDYLNLRRLVASTGHTHTSMASSQG